MVEVRARRDVHLNSCRITYSQQHDNVSLAHFARIVQRLRPPYRVVYFLSVDWHILGSIKSKSDLETSNLDHRNDDVVVDDDALVLFSRQNEHSLSLAPEPSLIDARNTLPASTKPSDISFTQFYHNMPLFTRIRPE